MVDRVDNVFRAMADGHRRKILTALCDGPQMAGELARLVGLAPNAVSFHLKWLKDVGLVSIQRHGRFLQYRANGELITNWKLHVESAFPKVDAGNAKARPTAAYASATAAVVEDDDVLPTELL